MKLLPLTILAVAVLAACRADVPPPEPSATDLQPLSYAVGVAMARNVKVQGLDVDVGSLVLGLKDGLSGQKLRMSDDDLRTAMTSFQREARRNLARGAETPPQ